MANKDEVKGHDTSGFNESTDSDQSADKSDLFDLHLSRLSSAKKEFLSQIRAEKEIIVNKYENILQNTRQEFSQRESDLRQTIDKLTEDHKQSQQKSANEINDLTSQLRQSSQELDESKRLVNELTALVKLKDSDLNQTKDKQKKCEEELRQKSNQFETRLNDLSHRLSEVTADHDSALKQVSSLTTRLDSREEEVQSLKSSLSSANDKNQSLENKCQTLLAENQRLRQSLDFEQKAKHESMDTIKSLTNSLTDNQREIERLQKNWTELERSRISEINDLRNELKTKEQKFKEEIHRLTEEKKVSDNKSVTDINALINKLKEMDEELHQIKTTAENDKQMFESIITEKEICIRELTEQKSQIETDLNEKYNKLSEELREVNYHLYDMNQKKDKALSQLTQMKNQLITADNEKEVLKTSLVNANEKCYSLEFQIDSHKNEIEKYKHLLENEIKEKREKTQMFETITDSLRERQSEVERLNKVIKDMEKNCKEFEGSRNSMMDDCHELRTTLMEVEKSRLEIRRELNNHKIANSSLENKLQSKDLEIQDLKKRFETLKEERNSLKDSLESSIKSLSQLKDMNNTLSQHNKQLSAQMSLTESERREFERQLNSSSNVLTDRDNSVSILKKDNISLKEKVNKLENEKKRLERNYTLLEKEKSVLKTTIEDIQRKSSKRLDTSDRNDVILDEAKIITQGLAALELKNLELQRKVQGLQSLMNEAEGVNGSDSGHPTNGDCGGNQSNDFIKLRLAQKHAEDLIDGKDISNTKLSNLDKELSRLSLSPSLTTTPVRFKEPPMRSQSVSRTNHKHQNTDTSTPLPLYSSTSGLQNVKRKLNYKT